MTTPQQSAPAPRSVMTVLGPRPADELGITLMHEHVFLDFDWPDLWRSSTVRGETLAKPIEMSDLGMLRHDPYAIRENARLDDHEVACEELARFRDAGGRTIVDLTTIGLGRDVEKLARVAQETGLHVVTGCGWYIAPSQPPAVREATVDELYRQLVRELTEGIEGTGIRAGIIGEIGTSGPVLPEEEKALRAAVRAHHETGAAVNVHCSAEREGVGLPRVIGVLREEEMPPDRAILSHLDQGIAFDRVLAAADEGFNIEFDCFGQEHYYTLRPGAYASLPWEPRDTERLEKLSSLIRRGHLSQLLVSQDVFLKMNLHHFGGSGYDHILTNISGIARRFGVLDEQFRAMMADNPARLLPF